MNNNNTIFKGSPLGKIPSDWEVKLLGDLTKKIGSGITPRGGEKVYKSIGRPFLRSQNVGWGTLLLDDIVFIDEETHKSFHSTEIKEGDVFLNITGASIGRSAVTIDSVIGGNVNQHVCIIRSDRNLLNPGYLNSFLLSKQGQNLIDSYQAGGNRQGLNFEQIRSFRIPLPPLPEQKAIAHILGLMDTTINKNNSLIAQKELQKKWLMQNLLIGKKRLKGFGLEWKNYKLEYFIEDYNEKPKDEIKYKVLTSAKAGLMKQTDYYGDNRITNREDADYNVIPPNYLTYRSRSDDGLFTFNKNTLGFVGLISGYYPVFTIKNGDLDFILMYCNFYRYKFKKYCIGTSQLVLSMNALKSANFTIPQKEEQTAIAEVLQEADKEIQLFKDKTEKLREQKKGLMQVLLTGKKRLMMKE